jgi:predicted site-specific integrase-resolvase
MGKYPPPLRPLPFLSADTERAAEAIGVSRATLERLAARGQIQSRYFSARKRVFLARDLERLVESLPTRSPTVGRVDSG